MGQYYSFANTFNPGFGYWVFAYNDCELWIESIIPDYDSYITMLESGWNLLSIPYDQPVEKDNLLVSGVNWDTAVANGWVNTYVYGWNRVGQYYNFANTFNPGEAYWLYASQPCVLKRVV